MLFLKHQTSEEIELEIVLRVCASGIIGASRRNPHQVRAGPRARPGATTAEGS
jgi:hypothetical protein